MEIYLHYKEIMQWKCVYQKHCRKIPINVEALTNFLFNWEKDVVSDPKVIQQVMPKLVSKGNDKYGGHCDGGFSELTGCCIYYPVITMFDVKWLYKPLVVTVIIPTFCGYGSRCSWHSLVNMGGEPGRMQVKVYWKFKESLILIQMVQTLHTSANILHVCIHQNMLTML